MAVRMRVNNTFLLNGVRARRHRTHEPSYIPDAENDQHDGHGEFHAQAQLHWNYKVEEDDSRTDHEDCDSVADTPECSDQRRPHSVALIANDGGDRNHVVRISGVAHPQKESKGEDGEKAEHGIGEYSTARGRENHPAE